MIHEDEHWMSLAISLAKNGRLTTRPNPNVGCVIVDSGEVVGKGWHVVSGQDHAEVIALKQAGEKAKGATAYVTLEPCSHYGRTPPCCVALVASGVSRVVVANRDPNPLVAGKGIAYLEQHGVDVTVGVLEAQAADLNVAFFHKMERSSPRVIVKMGCSLDGRIAMASGESRWITGEQSRQDVHQLRARTGAILTSSRTVNLDNPRLNLRHGYEKYEPPLVFILLGNEPLNLNASLLSEPHRVFTVGDKSEGVKGIPHVVVKKESGRACLSSVLMSLSDFPFNELLVEAGAGLAGELVRLGLVDELVCYMSPLLLGQNAKPLLNLELDTLSQAKKLQIYDVQALGNDMRISANFLS